MHETTTFGEIILLKHRIWTRLDSTCLWIEDIVENQGFRATPHMFLQHFILGFPLVDTTARLVLPDHLTQPRDTTTAAGLTDCCKFCEPYLGFQEQVFYHDLTPGPDGRVKVSLVNPSFNSGYRLGMTLRYLKSYYPILVEWKMLSAGTYVIGLEPANCRVGGRCVEREAGTLQMLQPQELRTYAIEVEFFNQYGRGSE